MVCVEWLLQYTVGVVILTIHHSMGGSAHMPPTHTYPSGCPGCPYFLETPTNINTAVGDAANLTCGVRMLGDRQVSWIRRRDLHVLTTDSFTYTTDSRFRAIHVTSSPYWILQVDKPAVNDSGIYECQVSAQPKIFRRFSLTVVVPRAEIIGTSEVFMKAGSEINITCIITGVNEQTSPVTWYHVPPHYKGSSSSIEEVNAGGRGGVQLVTDRRAGSSWLLVTNATWRDAGNYTCAPAHATQASVSVHVLDEEIPAAMQPDLQASNSPPASPPASSSSSPSSSSATGAVGSPPITSFLTLLLLYDKGFFASSQRSLGLLLQLSCPHVLTLAFVFLHRLFFKTIYFPRGFSSSSSRWMVDADASSPPLLLSLPSSSPSPSSSSFSSSLSPPQDL